VGAQPEFGPRDFEPIGRERVRLEAVTGSQGALGRWIDRIRREPKKWAAIARVLLASSP
jgi:hypothetical protein